jgi:hypothetical protein
MTSGAFPAVQLRNFSTDRAFDRTDEDSGSPWQRRQKLPMVETKGAPCIKLPKTNSSVRCTNSCDGARSPRPSDRRLRHGGGDRRLKYAACRNRCLTRGAQAWSCRAVRPMPRARSCFLVRSPTRHRCHGRTIFRAGRRIRFRPDTGFVRFGYCAAFLSLARRTGVSRASSAAGCSGGEGSSGAGRSRSASSSGRSGLLNRNPCISSQA